MLSTNEIRLGELLTIDQASALIGISKSLLRSELRRTRVPVVRLGRRLLIPPQACDELVRLGLRPFHPYNRGRDI